MSTQELQPSLVLNVSMAAQPTETSCGPTCLQAVYGYYGDRIGLEQLIREVPMIEGGGTLAVHLGIHALSRGYEALLYTYNLRIFDPTWFQMERNELEAKLQLQVKARRGKRRQAAEAYLEFVQAGGRIGFEDLTGGLIRRILKAGTPILTGLSATFLYRSMREVPETNADDDIQGEPLGHFVILQGYHRESKTVMVADPYQENPLGKNRVYEVSMQRLINSILLGVLTYDANLLIVRPRTRANDGSDSLRS